MPSEPGELPLAALIGAFAVAAACVWVAGTRLAGYVNEISDRTGLGKAFTGMLLLGGITSLPEVAAVSTSAAIGNAPLATNNLLGAASVNLLLLAVADAIYGRGSLTAVAARPPTLMQGVLSMLLAATVAIFAAAGDVRIGFFGLGSLTLAATAVLALWIASRYEHRHVWEVVDKDGGGAIASSAPVTGLAGSAHPERHWSTRKLVSATIIAALVILAAGLGLATFADALAGRPGTGSGMVGFVLLALATAMPEISSVTAAVRLRQYDMALGDIFGTNLFNLALIFLADLVYAGEPVLEAAGTFEVVGALLAVLLTGFYVVGLLQRRSKTILRMGLDSLAALLVFCAGIVVLSGIDG